MKSSMSEMVSLGEKRDDRVGVKIFLAGGCKEEVLVIKESVEGFGELQEQCLVFGTGVQCRREVRFEIEGVEVGVSRFMREKILFTGTEVTTRWVREVQEVIVLDEGTRGVGEEVVWVEEGWDVVGGESVLVMVCGVLMVMHLQRRTYWKPQIRASCLASLSVKPCLK